MTLKLGSKGEDVKTLQMKLDIDVDGDFGTQTREAVKEFQRTHNLVVDGVVGDKTWILLMDNIIYDPLKVHITRLPNRKIDYIVIHFTAGTTSHPGKAKTVKKVFEQRQASADFCVDDRDIIQFNPSIKDYYCWAVGDSLKTSTSGGKYHSLATNKNTINIEICSNCTPPTAQGIAYPNHSGWIFSEESLNNTIRLVKLLMNRYNIDKEHVIRHYDVTGKSCPGIIGWNDEDIINIDGKKAGEKGNSNQWKKFKANL